ncbi:hypothetical protein BGZ63DRAFT_201741 [Mariannaea sp. PMI_226]|nr:hypothetical protein BGZ63DRAFT_201741 [Mariannaea sp. PMI_226]
MRFSQATSISPISHALHASAYSGKMWRDILRALFLLLLSCAGLCKQQAKGQDITSCIPSNTTASEWSPNTAYIATPLVAYGGNLYMCLEPHESQPDWTPPATLDLWATPMLCCITPWKS